MARQWKPFNFCLISGDKKRQKNPSKYRDPSLYHAMFFVLSIPSDNPNEVFGFELVLSKPVSSYIKVSLIYFV